MSRPETVTTTYPLLRTKLHRPQAPHDLVPRPRLLERLDERRQRQGTLVSAPAGYGRTTLVSSWLEAADVPYGWVSLDEYDNDLGLFVAYMSASIHTMFPDAVAETVALLSAPALPPVPVLARSLANELDKITSPFVLVLDDYHVIDEAAIQDLLNELLRHPPRAMHLVIVTRRNPSLSVTRLRATRHMPEVWLDHLRFTAAETAAYQHRIAALFNAPCLLKG